MKIAWNYLTGNLIVTVKALNNDNEPELFTFECYVSSNINPYDKLDNIHDIAQHSANLHGLYLAEIVDIKQK